MSKKLTKTESQRWHFKWQIKDRYGIFCNGELYNHIVDLIKTRQSVVLLKQSNTRYLHKVYVRAELTDRKETNIKVPIIDGMIKVYLIYDKSRGELVTALPYFEADSDLIYDYEKNHKYSFAGE